MPLTRRLTPNIILIVLVLLGLAYITARDAYVARQLHYDLTAEALVIRYRRERVVLPYGAIRSVTFFREPMPLRGSWFTTLGRSRFGRYYLEGVGQVEMYAADAKRPLIVVKQGYTQYGLTPAEAGEFHRRLLDRLPRGVPRASLRAE
ncbi:MAG: PH domain-containing protein [Bacteroidota bacterium]